MCSTSPVRTPKLELAAKQPLTEECWIPPKNKTKQNPMSKSKGEAPARVYEGQNHVQSQTSYPLQYFCLENPMDSGAW